MACNKRLGPYQHPQNHAIHPALAVPEVPTPLARRIRTALSLPSPARRRARPTTTRNTLSCPGTPPSTRTCRPSTARQPRASPSEEPRTRRSSRYACCVRVLLPMVPDRSCSPRTNRRRFCAGKLRSGVACLLLPSWRRRGKVVRRTRGRAGGAEKDPFLLFRQYTVARGSKGRMHQHKEYTLDGAAPHRDPPRARKRTCGVFPSSLLPRKRRCCSSCLLPRGICPRSLPQPQPHTLAFRIGSPDKTSLPMPPAPRTYIHHIGMTGQEPEGRPGRFTCSRTERRQEVTPPPGSAAR